MEALAGLLAGLLAGTFGVGGGAVTIPFLVFMLHLPLPIAVGTNLLIVSVNSVFSFLFHAKQGTVEWKGFIMGLLGAAATLLGNYLFVLSVKVNVLNYIIGFAFIGLSIILWYKVDGYREPSLRDLSLAGLIMGIYSALIGKGGGSIAVPTLVALFKVKTKEAIKASVVATPVVAITAATEKCLYGMCSLFLAVRFIPFMIFGSFVGSKIMKASSSEVLKKAYSAFLFIVGLAILLL